MDLPGAEMLQMSPPIAKSILPSISNVNARGIATDRELKIEKFEATEMSMSCLQCSNYVKLKNLEGHRILHDALSLYQYDFKTKPNNEQDLSRQRVVLVKNLNKVLNVSRSAYRKELSKIDLAYEVIKSDMFGRCGRAKANFIEHHDVIIKCMGAKLQDGATLGVCECTNEKWRSIMEDAYCFIPEFTDSQNSSYFAVFDGYSGQTAAKKCSDQFAQVLKEAISSFDKCTKETGCNMSATFCQAFAAMDNVLLFGAEEKSCNRWSGCSVCTCLLTNGTLHVANVGNVKAILIRDDDSFQTLTEDHTPANKKEKHRIKASGDIRKWSKTVWVNGVVLTTRGLGNHGDAVLKSNIINVPACNCISLADDGEIILVATYGFWQVFGEDEVIVLIKEWLMEQAREMDSTDSSINYHDNFGPPSSSIEVVVQHEEGLEAESSGKCSQMQQQGFQGESLKELLRDFCMKFDSNVVAVELSKHLMRAALTAGSKENITVMVVIHYGI